MKSTTFSRCGVTESGAIEMSASPVARIGTLVSWLTGTISSFTLRRFAYSFASTQAGPENFSPVPEVFSGSHGNSPIAAALSAPRALMVSIFLLLPGAGTSVASASAWLAVKPNTSSAGSAAEAKKLRRCMVFPPVCRLRPDCAVDLNSLHTCIQSFLALLRSSCCAHPWRAPLAPRPVREGRHEDPRAARRNSAGRRPLGKRASTRRVDRGRDRGRGGARYAGAVTAHHRGGPRAAIRGEPRAGPGSDQAPS